MSSGRAWLSVLGFSGAAFVVAGCATGGSGDVPDLGVSAPDAMAGGDATTSREAKAAPGQDATISFGDAGSPPGVDATPITDAGVDTRSTPGDTGSTGSDTGTGMDASCPTGMTGPDCSDCAIGFHLCGSTCTANGANDPNTGCATACGSGACLGESSGTAYCTDAGTCGMTSSSCPAGEMMCAAGCAACCSDTDCPAGTPTCSNGTCTGSSGTCPPGFGTCVTPCDTDMTQSSNCGACGNDCNNCDICNDGPFGACPIPFFGGTGCDCEGDGEGDVDTYSCF